MHGMWGEGAVFGVPLEVAVVKKKLEGALHHRRRESMKETSERERGVCRDRERDEN